MDSAVLAGNSQTTLQTNPLARNPPSPLSNRGHPVGDGPPPGLAANDERKNDFVIKDPTTSWLETQRLRESFRSLRWWNRRKRRLNFDPVDLQLEWTRFLVAQDDPNATDVRWSQGTAYATTERCRDET